MVALAVLVAGGSVLAALVWLGRILLRVAAEEQGGGEVPGVDLERRLLALEAKVELLPMTWEEFRDGAIRAEARARHYARKAAASAAEESVELEDPEPVRGRDAEGSGGQRVLALYPSVGPGSASDPENELLRLAARIKGYA